MSKLSLFLFGSFLFLSQFSYAQSNCFSEKGLKQIDLSFEKAQLESDHIFLNKLLADEFIWIHNHASMTDNKAAVVNRAIKARETGRENAKSRKSKAVSVIIKGNTAIVTGYTVVNRPPNTTNYNFMRTYVKEGEECLLLANHTMAVPD